MDNTEDIKNKSFIKLSSSPLLYGDITSYKSFQTNPESLSELIDSTSFNGNTDLMSFVLGNDKFMVLHENDNNYVMINDNINNNYIYKFLGKDKLNSYSYFSPNDDLYYFDDSLLYENEKHDKLSTHKLSIEADINEIEYTPYLKDLTLPDPNVELTYGDKSDDNAYIYLYLDISTAQINGFNINNYIYELRINSMPTKYFSISTTTVTNISQALQIKIDAISFKKRTGITDLSYFQFTIRNKFIDDSITYNYTRFTDFMKPYISYDSMTETSDDITINCRYDLSIETTNQTNNIVIDINNPEILSTIDGGTKPIIDNSIIFDMVDRNINLRALSKAIIHMNNKLGNNYYLISSKDINFEKEDYKVYSNSIFYNNTKTYLLKPISDTTSNGQNQIDFVVESITDIKNKKNNSFSINLMKLNNNGIEKINNNDKYLNMTDIKSTITINFLVVINPDTKFEYTDDENEIMKNIFSFQTNTISAYYGSTSLLSITANNNIKLIDNSELNSTELIDYINNGGRDLTYINNTFNSYDILFYGIYIDFMVLSNPNIGEIFINRINNLNSDDPIINEQKIVCNVVEDEFNITDGCNDGFNEKALTVKVNGVDKRIVIVPDTVFKLFNFLNSDDYTGTYSMDNTTENIFLLNNEEFTNEHDHATEIKKKINESSLALYPFGDFTFAAKDLTDIQDFESSNLYIDYYPIIHRLSKDTTKDAVVWSIYTGEKVLNLKSEKIIKLTSKPYDNSNESKSEITDENLTINDTNSIIHYPSFVNFKIAIETDGGNPTKIDEASYIGKIINQSELPVIIKDISLTNFLPDSKLFKTNDNGLSDESFMIYSLEGSSNYIKTDKIKIAKSPTNHDDVTIMEGNIIILKPGGILNVNISNSIDINNIPKDFGKTLNKLSDSLHYELYYIQDNEKNDNIDIPYTFRESGGTTAINFETIIDVYPLVSSTNFDDDYIRYGKTVYNIISNDIQQRSVAYRLIFDNEDINKFSDSNNYKDFIDNVLMDESLVTDLYYYEDNISILDMEDIYFLESGKNFSYRDIYKKIYDKYKDNEILKDKIINNTIGLQVVARTMYTNEDKEYNMAIITNYLDLFNNSKNFIPKLNRLTGSLYHLLTIENKHEEYYNYKIIVDGKERKEGDIISNTNANEIALHKFRLYYKPKTNVHYLDDEVHNDDWILADSFEGCLDGTKPIVPNLSKNNKKLHKFVTLTRDEIKDILYKPEDILSEVNFYKSVNLFENISYDMKYEIEGTAGISKLKVPVINNDNNNIKYIVTASDRIQGMFQIENTSKEKLNIQINQNIKENEKEYPFIIKTNATAKQILINANYQPIYTIDPEQILTVYIQFNTTYKKPYSTELYIRTQNNIKKKYSDDNIKWESFIVTLNYLDTYDFNKKIIKQILPYSFYDNDKNNTEYYDMSDENILNIIDINNFNKSSLYSNLIYLDDKLIYNSNNLKNLEKDDENYKLLVNKKILNRYLNIGDHTLTLITIKFNGLINYQNYFITIIDHNVYNNDIEPIKSKNYFLNTYLDNNYYGRNSLILRNPRNNDYNNKEFENELFMDSNGNPSLVTEDISTGNYYLYKFTEIINHYMNLSNFIVDSDYYLFEKNYQKVLRYYNIIKLQYDSYTNEIFSKLDKTTGEIYNILNKIEYKFITFEDVLDRIKKYQQDKEENKVNIVENEYKADSNFISRLFYEDGALSEYKEYNILYDTSIVDNENKYKINIDYPDTFKYEDYKDKINENYIDSNNSFYKPFIISMIALPMYDIDKGTNVESDYNILDYSNIITNGDTIGGKSIAFNIQKAVKELKNPDISYKIYMFMRIIDNSVSYIYTFNMYNIKDSLSIDNLNDIKFSTYEQKSKTIINRTNVPITISVVTNNISTDEEIKLVDNTNYTMDNFGLKNEGKSESSIKINYQTDGYFSNENKDEIVLYPHTTCKIIFTGIPGNKNVFNADPPVTYSKNYDEKKISENSSINNKLNNSTIVNTNMSIRVNSLGLSDSDSFYKYNYNYQDNYIKHTFKLVYSPFSTIFLSNVINKNINYINIPNIQSNENHLVVLINDCKDYNEYIVGNFTTNNIKNFTRNSSDINNYDNYFPFRKNDIFATVGDNDDYELANTYNDYYALRYLDFDTFVSFDNDNCFPMIIENSDNDLSDISNISLSIYSATNTENFKNEKDLATGKKRSLNNIKFIYSGNIGNKKLNYLKLSGFTFENMGDSSWNLYEGAVKEKIEEYRYGMSMNNSLEYFITTLSDLDKNNKIPNRLLYFYFNYINESTVSSITGIENKMLLDLNNLSYNDIFNYSNLEDIYKAFNFPDKTIDNNLYSKVINIVNSVENGSSELDLNIDTDEIKNIIRNIYKIKSNISIIQQNIYNQKKQLSDKASVKQYKEWINENVFKIADFEYGIKELFANIYGLSNKGISVTSNYNEEDAKTFNFNSCYPIINIDRYLDTAKFINGDGNIAANPNRWASNFLSEEDKKDPSTINYLNLNDIDNFFIKKIWINTDNTKVDPVFYKKNFIDTTNIFKPDLNDSSMNYSI